MYIKNTLSLLFSRFFTFTFSFLLLIIFFYPCKSFAQLSEGGTPYSFNNELANPVVSIEMPPINIDALLAEDENDEKNGIPFRFGFPIEVNLDIKRSGTFELLPNSDKLWSLHISAPGASSLNLNYNDFWLPAGAKFYIFNNDKSELIGAFTKRNNKENGEFATGILRGDGVTLEYYEPAVVESPGIINISSVVYGYRDIFKKLETDDFGSSGACNNNTICPEGEPWSNEIRAAAMILTAGGSRLCSGSMVNNVRQDLTPYFLTANHCGSSSNWIIMFRYESPQCSPSVNGPLNYTVQGTQLKANNTASDFALFLLTEAPPDSYEVHFAGWSAIDVASTNSVGIHHPAGDVKKISFDDNPTTSSDYEPSPYLPNSHWKISVWDDGTTEPGSSGSPLYDQDHKIMGQLHGGWASCTSLTPDYYGKFSMSWNYGSTPSTRLKEWLDPDNTGTLVLDGWDPTIGDPDTIAPTTITNLAVTDPTSNSLSLSWTAPLDTSYGGVKAYDIRISDSPITDLTAFQNAQQISFPGLPAAAGSPENLEVMGLDFTSTYYFAIRSKDFWQNWSDISNSPSGTTFGAPAASVNPASVHVDLMNNTTFQETVTLSNMSAGNSTLDYNISLENNTFPEGMVRLIQVPVNNEIEGISTDKDNPDINYGQSIDGSGGPDAFGYKWIDSDEPNGPVYIWEDIVSTGTQVTNWVATGTFDPRDEGVAGPFNLGFNFKFYGNLKNQIHINTNGIILFNTINENIYTNVSIPNSAAPNEFIAPFWDDLDGITQGTVHYKQDGNRFIIQFTNWQKYSGTGSLTFQVVLYSSGKILVYYNNMNATLNSATVGIENGDGTIGLQVVYNAAYVNNGLALQFSAEPDWLGALPLSGRLYNGNSVDIDLEFRTEDFPLGDYSMDMVITSNDPANPTITVPVTMTVVVPVELTSLTAESEKNSVTLKWATSSETNNRGFEIQKSNVKRQTSIEYYWENVGFVEGKGSTTERQSYSFSENNLQVGKYIYRLKQIDYDGTYEYSPEVEIDVAVPSDYTLMQNYPNPFNPMTTIEYSLPENAEVRIDIYSPLGELVRTLLNNTMDAGYQKVSFDASQLPSGTYIYQIKAKGQTKSFVDSKKMLLVK